MPLRMDVQAVALTRAIDLLREVRGSGVEFEDPRVGYLTVQIDRVTWDEISAFLDSLAGNPPA